MIERGIGSETGVDWKMKNEYTYTLFSCISDLASAWLVVHFFVLVSSCKLMCAPVAY